MGVLVLLTECKLTGRFCDGGKKFALNEHILEDKIFESTKFEDNKVGIITCLKFMDRSLSVDVYCNLRTY